MHRCWKPCQNHQALGFLFRVIGKKSKNCPNIFLQQNDCRMRKLLIVIFIILNTSCGKSIPKANVNAVIKDNPDSVSFIHLGTIDKNTILVEHDVNLNGGVCQLPKGMSLYQKGGVISNGTLIGNGTEIKGRGIIFDKIIIKGNWNVPDISTRLFANLDDVNSLRQVVALAHPNVKNIITIEKGNYQVKAEKDADVCIPLCSNTNFVLNGSVRLEPNDFAKSDIIQVKGENIHISGNGIIKGDKFSHTGEKGEWGMGINFKGATNSSVSGLTIQECWGDCIYVGGKSNNILIEKCKLNHGRRQGMSVTKADGVTIRDCKITKVKGTSPQYAIDIEPNRWDSVNHVLIENVQVEDCMGGFYVTRHVRKEGAKKPWVGNVTIRDCEVHALRRMPIRVKRCDEEFKMEGCTIHALRGGAAISIVDAESAEIRDNKVIWKKGFSDAAVNAAKKALDKKIPKPISISNVTHCVNKNNQILKR